MKWLLVLPFALGACGFLNVEPPPPPPPGTPTPQLVGNFNAPTYVAAPPADSARLFVVEQGGRVIVVRHDTTLSRPFLDITGKISTGGERGLLSIAFHPQYASNGRFYVYFTNPAGDIRVVRYNVSSDPDSAIEASADTVIAIPHPGQSNHNGGQLQFGPDGMLWMGTGDGGGGGDPDNNGQDKHTLLGKLLRLDVSGASGYTIPAGNPGGSDTSFAPEVWSYGLRNPWRFSFDRGTGDLYIADVGQDAFEEIDVSPTAVQMGRGANFGWNRMEGAHCYPNATGTCNQVGLLLPYAEYAHGGGTCAITGGYVYRGSKVSLMAGYYFFADYCTGFVRSIKYGQGPTQLDWTQYISPGANISSFGEDAAGELYVVLLGGGVYRIVPMP
ncbi:MAG TPA: PQQ-dependent sugar dehydrogenase [Gemmatimonadales bacterium]|nr:PQQ-dependent sugar dehydrogenase [Gemmatimonadales bacterium]